MSPTPRTTARWVAAAVAVLVAVGAVLPLSGPTPVKCTYSGDVGRCETLVYRSALTVALATVMWGRDVVNDRP